MRDIKCTNYDKDDTGRIREEYVLKRISLIEKLKVLEVELNADLQIYLILQIFQYSFEGFYFKLLHE